MEREITDEQVKKLTALVKVFRPDIIATRQGELTEEDLSNVVAGIVAGNVDKMLGDRTEISKWRF